jgi:ribosomal protein L12E/L44/L45/RPP1/RPP2
MKDRLTKEQHKTLLTKVGKKFDTNADKLEVLFNDKINIHSRLFLAQSMLTVLCASLDEDDIDSALAAAQVTLLAMETGHSC